ncbi:MAG: LytTR family DNA-binding domain-containing protein [Bacillota bacterium]|nr:LytTR family DNA-binding domain-containing protein [Bacillota bacterium]
MRKRSILIIEDNQDQRGMLVKLVGQVDGSARIHTAGDVATAYKILMENTIDVFLVDIILDLGKKGDISGIKLVDQIRKIPKYMFTPVLFITSLEDATGYAYQKLNCLGYVEKPFSPDQVKQLVEKALYFSTQRDQDATYCFRKKGILFPVKISNILYMESNRHVVNIYTQEGGVLSVNNKTLKEIEEEMDADCMMMCSRNTVINKDFIENIDVLNRFITLKDSDKKIEIGKTFKKKVLAEYKV